jgi:hypothetical protein
MIQPTQSVDDVEKTLSGSSRVAHAVARRKGVSSPGGSSHTPSGTGTASTNKFTNSITSKDSSFSSLTDIQSEGGAGGRAGRSSKGWFSRKGKDAKQEGSSLDANGASTSKPKKPDPGEWLIGENGEY